MTDKQDMSSARERVVVIAGAGPGLGRALCAAFTREGAAVLACSLRGDGSTQALLPWTRQVFETDLTQSREVELLAHSIEQQYGVPDVFVYNAGQLLVQPFEHISERAMLDCYHTNFFGAFLCAQRFLPAMAQRGSGSLMFTGASTSLRAVPKLAACVAAKHALRGLCEALACEYEPRGIQISHMVVDGVIDSPKTRRALGAEPERCLQPDAIAAHYVAIAGHGDHGKNTIRCRELIISAASTHG